ncbi:MAG: SagB/ThcOx family dehydrogenase [Desulfobacterota bacterium]|jgi:SagB-type dehydrogenase family enzyme|nr:SagB/ThcOx family dehydrogenase [Thermodesulfobacteriota bacterium]
MERRVFLVKLAALGAGLATLLKGTAVWAKGLPSDPGTAPAGAGGADLVSLPPFEKTGGFALEKALLERKSFRSYDASRKLSPEEVSKLLWATTGVNRTDNKRTVPSARASYPVDMIVALPEGVYGYDPKGHLLKKILSEDIRSKIPNQEGFKSAAMIVLYVINKDKVLSGKIEWADLEIGCMGQSLFLEAVALGLGSCIFAGVATDHVSKIVGLKENQMLRIAQAVGGAK